MAYSKSETEYEDTKEKNKKYIKIASKDEIPNGKTKHVQINGEEIMVANANGKYYAISDRCGHANVSLSCGSLNGTIITCPLHGAQFDIISGKNIKNFNLTVPSFDKLPQDFQESSKYALNLVGSIKTHDQRTFEVIIEKDGIMINTSTQKD